MSMKIDVFLAGLSSIFALFPQPVRAINSTFQVDDAQAMAADWAAVGNDIKTSMSLARGQQKAAK